MSDEKFGQCAPADATMSERLECCAALLALDHPGHLLTALFEAGIRIVDAKDWAVLEACAAFPTGVLEGDVLPSRQAMSDISWCWTQAELARRRKP